MAGMASPVLPHKHYKSKLSCIISISFIIIVFLAAVLIIIYVDEDITETSEPGIWNFLPEWIPMYKPKQDSKRSFMQKFNHKLHFMFCEMQQVINTVINYFKTLWLPEFHGYSLHILTLSVFILLATVLIVYRTCAAKHKSKEVQKYTRKQNGQICDEKPTEVSIKGLIMGMILVGTLLSVPWEFVRLYQSEVARKAAMATVGPPPECTPAEMTPWQSVLSWIKYHVSWDHSPCETYHHALMVDPLWEVTPLMVLSSLFTRGLMKPLEICCSTIGRSFNLLFRDIPAAWQPFIMVFLVTIVIITMVMVCSYHISIPLIFRMEPFKKERKEKGFKVQRIKNGTSTTKKVYAFKNYRNYSLNTLEDSDLSNNSF